MAVSNLRRVLSLVAGCLIHFIFGSMYTLGTITPYIASHIYYKGDHSIKIVDVSINYPIMMITQTLGILVSMIYLQFIFKMKTLCFVGVWGFALSVFTASFMNHLWNYTIFYSGFFGLFVGITYMHPLKNAYSYFPHRKGMCSGIIMMVYGFGPFTFNQIIVALVNPENLPSNQQHIFPPEVANNFPTTLKILSIIYFAVGTIGCLLIYPLQKQLKQSKKQQQHHQAQQQPYSNVINDQRQQQPLIKQNQQLQQKPLQTIKKFFKQNQNKKKEIFKLWLTIYFSAIYAVFISYNYKQYGEIIVNNDYFITLAGSVGCIMNSLGRLLWCNLFDCLSFKMIMTILDTSLLCLCTVCIFVKNQNVYMLTVMFTYFFSGSFYGLMPTQTVRMLGDGIGSTIYPIIFSGFMMASISQFILHKVVLQNWGDAGFKGVFIGLVVFNLTALIFVQVFNYQYVNQQDKKLENKNIQNKDNIITESS